MNEHEIIRDGGRARVILREKLTVVDIPSLQPALKREITAGVREIVFDLAQTVTMDSTGIGLLIASNNSLASLQGTIRLINLSPDLFTLLQHMRLVDRLHATAAGTEVARG